MILADQEIELLGKSGMIVPYDTNRLNSFGYDLTLSEEFLVPSPSYNTPAIIDPKSVVRGLFGEFSGEFCIIPANSFILGRSVEKISIPPDVIGLCLGRSSYARCGIITNVTPLEPGWIGEVTIEISNTNRLPAKVYANEGVCQVIFLRGNLPLRDYVAKGGRYQYQKGITLARGL